MYVGLLYCLVLRFLLDIYLEATYSDSFELHRFDNVSIVTRPNNREVLGVVVNRGDIFDIWTANSAFKATFKLVEEAVSQELGGKIDDKTRLRLFLNSICNRNTRICLTPGGLWTD